MDSLRWDQRPRKVTFLLFLLILCFTGSLWHNCMYVTNYESHQSIHPRWRWDRDQEASPPVGSNQPPVYDNAAFNVSELGPNDYHTLADLTNFQFLIQSHRCDNSSDLFLLVFVHSAPSHAKQRQTIRQTWGREDSLPQGLRLVFLLGETNWKTQSLIEKESFRYGDIIQGNFHDSYRNLTYKHIMGLKWITYFCQQVAYVLKADDDIFIDINQLAQYISNNFGLRAPRHLMYCFTVEHPYVKRSRRSKWYVTYEEYRGQYYPTYCSGWSVLMSPDVVFSLYVESAKHDYFWVDDVHITGILAEKIGLKHKSFNNFLDVTESRVQSWLQDNDDVYPLMFSHPDASSKIVRQMWEKTKRFYDRNKIR